MTHRIERKKWILYRHTNNFDLLTAVAANLKSFSRESISNEDKKQLLLKLKELEFYKERNPEMPLDAINHRINELAYYMFGYKDNTDGKARFMFSPLGNLFLRHIGDSQKLSKIFLAMLCGLQFQHPHGGSDPVFKLYPFRLVFKLLLDSRLDNKLYAYEFAYYVVFEETMNEDKYEALVRHILDMRSWPDGKIEAAFKEDEHAYVNSTYEWDYYVSELLKNAGVLNKDEGEVITTLHHGKSTLRKLTRNHVSLSENLTDLCKRLLDEFPFDEQPLPLDDPERMTLDVVKEIYSFYPRVLLEDIGELDSREQEIELLNLPKLIEQYSNNNEGEETDLFEDVLVNGFNQFYNVEAKKISGPGNTDVECLYISKKRKFSVDAKSTKNKLSGINSGRLAGHREKIGGEYTIVVTPRYVPAVLQDIKSTPIVIIRASTFSEYLYNCINSGIRKIDYADFDDIIVNNLGTDVSSKISRVTIEKFAVKS